MNSLIPLFLIILFCVTSGFKVVTYNIANYNDHPPWPQRLNLLAQILAKADADVISLQEVRFDPTEPTTRLYYENQAEEILRILNTKYDAYLNARIVTLPSMYYPTVNGEQSPYEFPIPSRVDPLINETIYWEGKTIISKLPVIETGTRYLTRTSDCTDKNLRSTEYILLSLNTSNSLISDNNGPMTSEDIPEYLYVYNTHFGLDGACLTSNTKQTISYINQHTDSNSYALLMGDFNATPDNENIQLLRDAGFVDLWEFLNPGQDGFTESTPVPFKRIDYFWGLNSQTVKQSSTLELIGDEPDLLGVYASDHLGLLATFSF